MCYVELASKTKFRLCIAVLLFKILSLSIKHVKNNIYLLLARSSIMLKVVIFDCDGTIADAEPVHLKAFQIVLDEEGINLSEGDYYAKYLALDDKTCFSAVLKDRGRSFDQALIDRLVARKSQYYDELIRDHLVIFPGVGSFVRKLHGRGYFLAIGSGALRHEIEFILNHADIRKEFSVIMSAEYVVNCKPHPEVFMKALQEINNISSSQSGSIRPYECLVVEDSIAGIRAAHYAGMKCLAVTNSYSLDKLSEADMIVKSLEEAKIEELEKLF
jgi:haloacid dehalogenase superfamily, subfamily IA, variant 3 with third motif having DD or ED